MKIITQTLPRILMILCLAGLAHLVVACGGDDKSLCEQTGEALCAEACACGGADGCILGDATGAVTFDDEAGCIAFMVNLGCSGDDGSLDAQFEACLDALDTGACVDTGSGQGFAAPAACN